MSFVHLHNHSEYSLLDGLSKIPEMVERAKKLKQPAIALTDHGVMYGTIPFYIECLEQKIKPIIGCEIYMAPRSRLEKEGKVDTSPRHLVLLAKNDLGYKNLMKIVTKAHLEGFYYKPRADWELLEKYHDGLIASTACLEGMVTSCLRDNKESAAEKEAKRLLELFGDDFYLELMSHPQIRELDPVNKKLINMSRKLGIPLIATNDNHYVLPEDAEAQDALLAIQTKKTVMDKDRLTMIDSPDFYIRSHQEMMEAFREVPDAIKNTLKIADKCDLQIVLNKLVYPEFPLPKGETSESYFHHLVQERMNQRFPKPTPDILQRVKYESEVICQKGYATYFLIVQDFVNWAKRNGIRVGPGRGSAAGSLVSYILRITSINPLVHNIPFERFLNPQRPSPPDIDLDFADERRDEVIAYVTSKYGVDKVAQIITFGRMEARGAIRDIGRVLGFSYTEPDKIAKSIPFGLSIHEALVKASDFKAFYANDRYKKLIDLAIKVEGVSRHASTHAAGVVIADKNLTEYTPLQRESKGDRIITQYDMYSLDLNVSEQAIGLMKMDFLGLRNLTILQKTIDLVKQERNQVVDISEIPLDKPDPYQLITDGNTVGVFQLESGGMRRLAKNLKPSRFSDITAMVALYRPGPMDLIPDFIRNKQHEESIVYPHLDLKPILQESYGILLYQDQVLQIANLMAGYSMAEADILRRAMGKKKAHIMIKEKQKFIQGAQKRGYTKQVADKVWNYVEKFAGYGFNKAHSVSYATIAYQTAYMKAYYPVEFMTALLTADSMSSSGPIKDEKISRAIAESKRLNINVQGPDINLSETWFTIEKDKHSLHKQAVRFGLAAIKNVGEAAIHEILRTRREEGAFSSLTDFCMRVDNQKVNKKVLESLIQSGAMDQFGSRAGLLSGLEKIRQKCSAKQLQSLSGQNSLFDSLLVESSATKSNPPEKDDLPEVDEFSKLDLLTMEKSLLGLYLTEHPFADLLTKLSASIPLKILELNELEHNNHLVTVGGLVTKVKKIVTKKNNSEMAFVTLDDGSASIEVVFFPKIYEESRSFLLTDKVVVIKGRADFKETKMAIIAEKAQEFDPAQTIDNTETVSIKIPPGTAKEQLVELQEVLTSQPGGFQAEIVLPGDNGTPRIIRLPYKIDYNQALKEKIAEILGN
jgi:DNA polymerase-3 subunit alpha